VHQVIPRLARATLESFEPIVWDVVVFSEKHGYVGNSGEVRARELARNKCPARYLSANERKCRLFDAWAPAEAIFAV
jgi:hypothetical protein